MSKILYPPAELARMLKVSERTIRRWVQKGDLPALRYGRQLRIPASALEKLGRPAAEMSNKSDWLAKCRAARAMMPLRGDSAKILQQIRLDKAGR
ncbi:DNA-binding protein [Moorella sp. E308F]|uniref:helix-turn-helix domain-containing protein n=1 Tax=Moorella sp. E308F TaxID=2572682 RepID=UPI0010FFACBF|nr:helix-turn-helix domain-containing protein [Moorella sp. E308F]GEA14668.1 DNA-binding protein [Moorella sp. E308F]